MKNLRKILTHVMILLIAGSLITVHSCKDDDDDPADLTLVSLMAGDIDLAGITAAADVPEDAVIEAVFSTEVDAATATSAVSLTNDDGNVDVTVTTSGTKVTITPTNGLDAGSQFTIAIANSLLSTEGVEYEGISLGFRTSGIFVPQKENMVLFLSFDNEALEDEAGDHTVTAVETVGFDTDRRGTEKSSLYLSGEGDIVEVAAAADLISPAITISFWMKANLADFDGQDGSGSPQTRRVFGLAAERGYFLEMGKRSKDPTSDAFNEVFLKMGTNHVNIGLNKDAVPQGTSWSEVNSQINVSYEAGTKSGWSYALDALKNTNDPPNRDYVRNAVMDKWIHFVLTIDPVAQTKTIYVDGVKWASFTWISSGTEWLFADLALKDINNDGAVNPDVEGSLALGNACSRANKATGWASYETQAANPAESKQFFKGGLDQFRIFSVALSDSEVMTLYSNEK